MTEKKRSKAASAMEKCRSTLRRKLCAFIPHHVGNGVVVWVLNLMRRGQRLLKKDFTGNLAQNERAFRSHAETIRKNGGYVEDQNSYGDMAYGRVTMRYAGCEIFAAYNAIYGLTGGHDVALPEMIAAFERDGMILSGKFGTAPKAIRDFLEGQGFRTEFVTKGVQLESVGERSLGLILTMYNDKDDILREVHTVYVSKDSDGYRGHNVNCNGSILGPCGSLRELMALMNGGRIKPICLIGIVGTPEPLMPRPDSLQGIPQSGGAGK